MKCNKSIHPHPQKIKVLGSKNHCLQLLRKENKEIPLDYTINVMESDEFLNLLSEEESPEEQLKALHHCLEKLPEEQRTSITRFFLEEMSYADIVEQPLNPPWCNLSPLLICIWLTASP